MAVLAGVSKAVHSVLAMSLIFSTRELTDQPHPSEGGVQRTHYENLLYTANICCQSFGPIRSRPGNEAFLVLIVAEASQRARVS